MRLEQFRVRVRAHLRRNDARQIRFNGNLVDDRQSPVRPELDPQRPLKLLILFLLPVEIYADRDVADEKRSRRLIGRQTVFRSRKPATAAFGHDLNAVVERLRAIASALQPFAGGIHKCALQLKNRALRAGHQTDRNDRLVINCLHFPTSCGWTYRTYRSHKSYSLRNQVSNAASPSVTSAYI